MLFHRWRSKPQTTYDLIKATESFIKKERRHTEQNQKLARTFMHRNDHYIYRERSIDDGSHFDPHLDKYPVAKNTLRRSITRETQTPPESSQDTLKRKTKLGGFEKVKQLFHVGHSQNDGNSSTLKKQNERRANSNITSSSSSQTMSKDKDKDKYMVKEEEMRSRYHEYNGKHLQNEPAAIKVRRLIIPHNISSKQGVKIKKHGINFRLIL